MLRKIILCVAILTATLASAVTPQHEISALVEKYPTMPRKIWYFYDSNSRSEYMRLQIWSSRSAVADDDVKRLKASFCDLWSATDFGKSVGSQYLGPDTVSITIKGNKTAAFDLSKNSIVADYAFNTSSKPRGDKPDFKPLEETFENIRTGHKTASTPVRYTGFKSGVTFTFHRGQGRGWTTGTRTTVYGASMKDFRLLRAAIRRFIGSKVPITVYDRTWQVLIKSESSPDFYAVGYDPETKQLNFLHATFEDQICIPLDWQRIDYITNDEIKFNNSQPLCVKYLFAEPQ